MPTVTASQLRTSANPLAEVLAQDVIITLGWVVDDAPNTRAIEQQECILELGGGDRITARVDPDQRSCSFRLAKGTRLTLPVNAVVEVNLAARAATAAVPAAPAVAGVRSAAVPIGSPSVSVPEREAISTVYGELNQELRRTRTLYESFLVVVTAGLATLYSKRDVIVGASHRRPMFVGLVTLAIIVTYMLWNVSRRYTRSVTWIKNLEQALGVRAGSPPEDLMPPESTWWTKNARPHTIWAIMLTAYIGILMASAGYLLIAPAPDAPAPTPPAQTQTITCDCSRTADSGKTSSPGRKALSLPKSAAK
jgi:hypothetical protein